MADYTGQNKEKGATTDDYSNLLLEKATIEHLLLVVTMFMVMSFTEDQHVNSVPLSSSSEYFLLREIDLMHDPDDRQIDSELLLHLVERTFSSAAQNIIKAAQIMHIWSQVVDANVDAYGISNVDRAGLEEPISLIIHKISNEILSLYFEDGDLHSKTMGLLKILSHYRWDTKVVLALASFAQSYGLFWLILQLQPGNELAVSLATVKRLPTAISMFSPKFKALILLVNTMVKVTKLIITFEGLYLQHELLDEKASDIIKSKIYMATYWIFRSIIECSSQISGLRNSRLQQMYLDETVLAACSLHSLGMKLNSLCRDLEEHVNICIQHIDKRLNEKLQNMFKESHADNQKVLRTLFAFQHDLPLKISSSQEKFGVVELKNKVVILLISKPELLPVDKIFSLVQWTYGHPEHKKLEENYAILWVPIASSNEWDLTYKTTFGFLSNSLPWFSIRRPWSLNPSVVKYIKEEWNFKEDPLMVVLNENGMVTNSNAMDIVWIWGPKAFPFSASREKELWEQEDFTLDLMIRGINPLLTDWLEEGKNIGLFGSDNIDWIRELNAQVKQIKSAGIQLEAIYVGCRDPGENEKIIIDTIDREKLCSSLTFTKVNFFWFRLEVIKRGHQESTGSSIKIANEVQELLEYNNSKKSWAVIGGGPSTDIIKFQAEKLKECFDLFPVWRKNVAALGLVAAIRRSLEPPLATESCHRTELLSYEEELVGKTLICSLCKSPMQKFVLYKCDVVAE